VEEAYSPQTTGGAAKILSVGRDAGQRKRPSGLSRRAFLPRCQTNEHSVDEDMIALVERVGKGLAEAIELTRCHSVRDCHSSFTSFRDSCVATDRRVKFVPLPRTCRFSGSFPRKPMSWT